MPTAIKDFKIKESYANLIEKALFSYFWDCIYKPLFEIMAIKPAKAKNEYNPLVEALKAGNIFYVKEAGGFKAKVRFSNQQSRILESWGAVYDKWTKTYKIPYDKIPQSMLVAISENQTFAMQKVDAVKTFLQEIEGNLDMMIDGMVFNNKVITILDDAGNEVKKNTKHLNVIEPELSKEQKAEIAENYVNNVKGYAIKFFGDERIPEMRQKVAEAILNGYRADTVQKMLETEYGIMSRKAKFWARNETALMLAEYKKSTYQEMGFDKFIWKTILDGRERDRHKHLNNKIFSYDNPPVIDDNGNVGLPGQTYNCRCEAIPYSDDNPFIKTRTDKNGQKIAINAKDNVEWITVKDNHIPVKEGQTKEQAVKEFLAKKGKQSKTNNSKPIAGIKQGKPMSFKQANGGKVNPKYTGNRDGYSGNCQTCIAVFEARLRGYDMQAIPFDKANIYMNALGYQPTLAYIDKKTGTTPYMLQGDVKRPSECEEWLKNRVKIGQRFAFIFKPMNSGGGHIIEVSKNILGQLKFYDPQSGENFNKSFLKEINYRPENRGDAPLIFRVDDKELNTDFLNRMYNYST